MFRPGNPLQDNNHKSHWRAIYILCSWTFDQPESIVIISWLFNTIFFLILRTSLLPLSAMKNEVKRYQWDNVTLTFSGVTWYSQPRLLHFLSFLIGSQTPVNEVRSLTSFLKSKFLQHALFFHFCHCILSYFLFSLRMNILNATHVGAEIMHDE